MYSNNSARKHGRLRAWLGKSKREPTITNAALPFNTNANDPFLEDVLKELNAEEQSIVQKHVAPNIIDSVLAAYEAAKEQEAACKSKRWPGSDAAGKVVLWLDRFKFMGDIASNADPIHFGLPWAGIRMLLEISVADRHQMIALLSGMNLALCVTHRLQAYFAYFKRLPNSLTTENFRAALVALYVLILRFLVNAIQTYTTSIASRKLQAVWHSSDIADFETRCNKLAASTDIEANNCDRDLRNKRWDQSTQWIDQLKEKLQELEGIQEVQKSLDSVQDKIDLSRLITVQDATYNSAKEAKLSQCLEGTRLEVMDEISQWTENRNSKLIFWLCGKAGTGKSTISRTLANRLDNQERLAASFFFKRGESKRSNADYFFSTVAAQLADMFPQMKSYIATALQKDSFLCGKGIQAQFDELLLKPLCTVESTQMPQKSVVIVVDALDECDRDTDIRTFLKLLAQVDVKSALHLRVFITSRPDLPIRLGFQKLDGSVHQDVVLEQVQHQSIRQDIHTYFGSEFTKIKEDRCDIEIPDEWPSENDLEMLVDLSVPLFIFASTVCRFISESKPQKRLQLILEQRYAQGSSQLAKTYLQILNQLTFGKEQHERQGIVEDFRRIIGPIVLVVNPLSVTSLASLLRIDVNDIMDLLRNLHSVLQVPSNVDEPVSTLHLSFRDFLIDDKRTDKEDFWLNEIEIHKILLDCCIRRLKKDWASKHTIFSDARPGTRRIAMSSEQISDYIPPDIAYACTFWPEHLVRSREALYDEGPVHQFLQRHFLQWLEALSWLGRIYNVIANIDRLLHNAHNSNSDELIEFLVDAKRFVLMHRQVLDLAPLQIYHSALIFTPSESVVRQTFARLAPKFWARLPSVPIHWSAEIMSLEGHNNAVTSVAFSPDGQAIVSGSEDSTVRLWNVATGEQIQKLEGHNECVILITFSPDGQTIASGSYDNTVRLWNAATGEQIQKLEGHDNWVTLVAFSPDGQTIASGSYDNTLRLWNVVTGERIQKLEGHYNLVTPVAFSPDGRTIASGSEDMTIRVWNAATGEQVQKLEGHNKWVTSVAFSPDGQSIVSGSEDMTTRLWNAVTGEQIQKLEEHNNWVTLVAFSPDGQTIASGSHNNTLRLWNVVTGEQIWKLEGQDNLVTSVAFSPDGRTIASGADNAIRLWNAATGEQIQILEGHSSKVTSVAFSPDGQIIVSSSNDSTIRLWNVATANIAPVEQTQKPEGYDGLLYMVAFSPDGQIVASAALNNIVRAWDVATGEVIESIADGNILHRPVNYTNRKVMGIDWALFGITSVPNITKEDVSAQTPSLELYEQWVQYKGEDLLWLPRQYRGCAATLGPLLAIGHESGTISFLQVLDNDVLAKKYTISAYHNR